MKNSKANGTNGTLMAHGAIGTNMANAAGTWDTSDRKGQHNGRDP
jgi:hypothetical protein